MTQEPFPDLVRQNCWHPVVEGGVEGERRRRRKEKELMEAQADDGGGEGGGERTGGDIQGAVGSGGRDLTHKDSSEDEAAVDETRRRRTMTMRCQNETLSLGGEFVDDFEDEDERDVP